MSEGYLALLATALFLALLAPSYIHIARTALAEVRRRRGR